MKKMINNQGFSLIEMIVTLFIITLITGVGMVSYRENINRNNVKMAAHRLSTNIRMAQNKALGALEYDGATPEGGWGIYLDSSSPGSYKLFANTNYNDGADMDYDAGEADEDKGGREFNFTGGVEITNISIGSEAHISFVPPDPVTYIYDGSSTSTGVEITLSDGEGMNKVKVNFFGLIEVE